LGEEAGERRRGENFLGERGGEENFFLMQYP
jgi:hypothetical protein